VLGDEVYLDVQLVPGRGRAEGRALEGLGDQGDLEPALAELGDGEADAGQRDRALVDHVAGELGREGDAEAAGEAVLAGREDRGDAVDVALDDVAAEPLAGPHRQLEVDARAGTEAAQGGDGEGLV